MEKQVIRAVLRAASGRLSNPDVWTRGVWARAVNGEEVAPNSPDACRWSLVGMIQKCAPSLKSQREACMVLVHVRYNFLDVSSWGLFELYSDLTRYNDTSSFISIINLLDRAIRVVKEG